MISFYFNFETGNTTLLCIRLSIYHDMQRVGFMIFHEEDCFFMSEFSAVIESETEASIIVVYILLYV